MELYPLAKLYRKEQGRFARRDLAWFVIIDNMLYPTIEHPDGQSIEPWFRIIGDELYPHTGNPCGQGVLPWYRRDGKRLDALEAHPKFADEKDHPFKLSGEWPSVEAKPATSLPESTADLTDPLDALGLFGARSAKI